MMIVVDMQKIIQPLSCKMVPLFAVDESKGKPVALIATGGDHL